MAKRKSSTMVNTTSNTSMMDDYNIPPMTESTDNASDLIYRLAVFYNKNPEYKTNLVEINILMRLAYQELEKFTHRPHTQITKVYFDSDAQKGNLV